MRRVARAALTVIAALFVLAVAVLGATAVHGQTIPHNAHQYRGELTRIAKSTWGLNAPIASLAAQIHQESAWNPRAVSRVGAEGLAQFMPATMRWISEKYPGLLSDRAPLNPTWALRAQSRYMKDLYDQHRVTNTCERYAFALSSYNGGAGNLAKDRQMCREHCALEYFDDAEQPEECNCDASRWFGHVEKHTERADWARKENRDYVRRIVGVLSPIYRRSGWGLAACHDRL